MKRVFIGLLVILLVACGNITGKTDFHDQIESMETEFHTEDWQALQTKAAHFKALYEDQQWKLQLLGDEGEYEDLNISIHRLLVAIEEENRTEAKLEIATIQTLIHDIYSL